MKAELNLPRTRALSVGGSSWRRWRLAALLGLVALLALGSFAAVAAMLSSDSARTISILVAARNIHAGAAIQAADVRSSRIRAEDPSLLSGLVESSRQGEVVGQTAAIDVQAGSPLPAGVVAPAPSADMWEVTLPVKRMPADLKTGDHVAILVTRAAAGDQIELVAVQDVRVLGVQSGSADLWLPARSATQLEWYGDHGGVVLVKQQPGSIQPSLPPGGLPT